MKTRASHNGPICPVCHKPLVFHWIVEKQPFERANVHSREGPVCFEVLVRIPKKYLAERERQAQIAQARRAASEAAARQSIYH